MPGEGKEPQRPSSPSLDSHSKAAFSSQAAGGYQQPVPGVALRLSLIIRQVTEPLVLTVVPHPGVQAIESTVPSRYRKLWYGKVEDGLVVTE